MNYEDIKNQEKINQYQTKTYFVKALRIYNNPTQI